MSRERFATLAHAYHWDLPQALEDKGGWRNRDITGWFEEYTNLMTKTYGDKVKNWMVLNEPMAFTAVGHLLGMHAPGKNGRKLHSSCSPRYAMPSRWR